jgi:phospholipase/carboxylesterase
MGARSRDDGRMTPSDTPLDPDVVRWSAPAAERAGRPLLVLLHGYGSDENDLFGLATYLPDEFVVASVRAPLARPWPMVGNAWYAIDALGRADGPTPPEAPRDASAVRGEGVGSVTAAASGFIEWLDATTDAPHVGLLGFSQGAAVALQALRLQPERFAFAVNLSGYAAPGELPRDAELAKRRPPVFWGRGTRDDVIPAALIEHSVEWLPAHVDLSGRVYPGLTHSVSEEELADVRSFLVHRLDELSA